MSADEGDHAISGELLERMNERQAWQLLNLDFLFMRLNRPKPPPFVHERLATGAVCYRAIASTGAFGQQPHYLKNCPELFAAVNVETYLPGVREDDATFAQSAAFLDLVSEWIGCDDIYVFLASPTPTMTPFKKFVIGMEMLLAPRSPLSLKDRILTGLDTAPSLNGFVRYVELSIDLRNFAEDDEFPSSQQWLKDCMARWFAQSYSDRVKNALNIFARKDKMWTDGLAAIEYLERKLDPPLLTSGQQTAFSLPITSRQT